MAPEQRPRSGAGRARAAFALLALLGAGGCRGALVTQYEYDEQIDLSLDGSAAVYMNASIPALVALRGSDLDVDPRARLDRARIGAMFEGPGVRVVQVTSSRRRGRRFVHVRLDVDDLCQLSGVGPFSWSRYRLEHVSDAYVFGQDVGPSANRQVGDVGWDGGELVAFRVHLPSRIRFHNSSENIHRGNILVWEQSLNDRRTGTPVHMEARMDTQSILYRTLRLFAATLVAAVTALALIVWWIMRKGKGVLTAGETVQFEHSKGSR